MDNIFNVFSMMYFFFLFKIEIRSKLYSDLNVIYVISLDEKFICLKSDYEKLLYGFIFGFFFYLERKWIVLIYRMLKRLI